MKAPKRESISATELARNLASTIDHVRLSGQVVDITKGKQIIAQLTPAKSKGFSIEQLEDFFQGLPHLDDHSLEDDLKKIRDQANLPDDTLWD